MFSLFNVAPFHVQTTVVCNCKYRVFLAEDHKLFSLLFTPCKHVRVLLLNFAVKALSFQTRGCYSWERDQRQETQWELNT